MDLIREGVAGTVSEASGGKYGAMPLTLHQRGYDAARIEYTSGVNSNASQSFTEAQKVERQTGDRIVAISRQQGREAAGAAYVAAGTSIAGPLPKHLIVKQPDSWYGRSANIVGLQILSSREYKRRSLSPTELLIL